MTASSGVDAQCTLLDDLHCVWVGVPDLAAADDILRGALGFEVHAEGERLPAFTPVPPLGSEPRRWRYYLAPGERSGAICAFTDRPRPTRPGLPRGWDCVEAVVADVDASARALAGLPGVVTVHAPFTSDLSDLGSNVHRSGVWQMPWGTHLILTAGLTVPTDREFPRAGGVVGRVFEVHLRTDDFATARHFYAHTLGMPALIDVEHTSGPMHDAWSLPDGHQVSMSFLKTGGYGTGAGAVEIQGHPAGALHAKPGVGVWRPGGTAMVTCTTSDLAGVREAAGRAGRAVTAPRCVEHGPMAGRRAVLIQGIESELLQVVER